MIKIDTRIFKFLAVGVLNTAIGLTAIYLAMWTFAMGPLEANAIGYAVGFLCGYALNRIWTFQGRGDDRNSFLLYLVVIVMCFGLNLAVVHTSIEILKINPYISQFFGMATYTVTSFIGCKTIVFK